MAFTVEVRLFGAFRDAGFGESVRLELDAPVAVGELKQRLESRLGMPLVRDSAVADERAVLDEAAMIEGPARLAILPPVCGG